MSEFVAYLDRKLWPGAPDSLFSIEDFDILTWGARSRFLGVVLVPDALVLDFKRFASFRMRIANVPNASRKVYWHKSLKQPYPRAQIDAYFSQNQDNPYGLWNFFLAHVRDPVPSELTQFPPLNFPKDSLKQRERIASMYQEAIPGDLVFTFDRNSGLAHLIRKWDRGMWSHCAMVGKEKQLWEATTSGVVESEFFRLCAASLDVALYRVSPPLSEEEIDRVSELCRPLLGRTNGYPLVSRNPYRASGEIRRAVLAKGTRSNAG